MDLKFLGTASGYQWINQSFGTVQWQPKTFYTMPMPLVTPPPMFLGSIGSAGTSLPTVSPYGVEYVAALNVLRQDYQGSVVFDVDRYLARPIKNGCAIYMEPPAPYHHLNTTASILNHFDPQLTSYIKKTLTDPVYFYF